MRSVAILTGPATHLDHLGVLSAWLEIPLIVTEETTFQLAKTYYPTLDVTLKDFSELSIDYLATHYDIIFETGKFWSVELAPFIELLYRKKMRFVFCPHGNSDKGHSLQNHVDQDISLVYGDHLFDHLKKTGALSKIKHVVSTGNYRLPFYLKHRPFYDNIVQSEILDKFKTRKPVILYAPTWQDRENPTSFFVAMQECVEDLAKSYNLVIKLHPFLVEDYPGKIIEILHQYENHPSVVFLTDFPPIYPLLSHCDIYLGDFSSIGYDFLSFDRPLYFLSEVIGEKTSLQQCGLEIPARERNQIRTFLEKQNQSQIYFSPMRQSTYLHAFGKEKCGKDVKKELLEICNKTSLSSEVLIM